MREKPSSETDCISSEGLNGKAGEKGACTYERTKKREHYKRKRLLKEQGT